MKVPLLIFFAWICTASLGQSVSDSVQFDFTAVDFSKVNSVELTGKWEFYWNKLLEPADFPASQKPEWLMVPGSWKRQGNHERLGYGTYRTTVKLAGTQDGLTLYIPIINASSRIWINGKLTSQTGIVSADKEKYKSELIGSVVTIPERIKNLEIIVQAANYTYYSSGMSSVPELGLSSTVFWQQNMLNGVDNFFAGSLMAMFIYQVILFFLYQRGKPHLWLSLICLAVATRSLIVNGGSFLLPNLFPAVSFEVWKKIEFGGIYGVIAVFPLYIYHLFPEVASKKILNLFIVVSVGMCLVVVFTPQYVYGSLLEVCHVSLLMAFAYAFYYIVKAWRQGSKDAKIILLGILIAFPFILLEILKNSYFFSIDIQFMYLVELGLLIFLLFQVYLLANHQAKTYQSLEMSNQNLERTVEERTHQLVTANTVRERLLSVLSHDLKSPLTALQGVLHMYNAGSISKEEFSSFTKQIEGDLSKTNVLMENMLFWTASQMKGINMKMERFNVPTLIAENLSLFETVAGSKKINQLYEGPTDLEINWDKNILNLVLRNLLANAIKFSFDGGEINIVAKRVERTLLIEVIDHGVGIKDETIKTLFTSTQFSNDGTNNEIGMGIGLSLCREYLIKAGGSLTVDSKEGHGSRFTISVPL